MSTKASTRELRAMLQDRLPDLMARLFPQERFATPHMTPLATWRADRKRGSFVVWTSGAAKGGFTDYAAGEKGDVFDLIGLVHGQTNFVWIADWARDFLGIRQMTPEQMKAAKKKADAAAKQAAAASSASMAAKRRRAQEIYMEASPSIEGSVVDAYLASREIPLALVPHREMDLRFHRRLEWWRGAQWDGSRKVAPGPHFPAMVAAIRNLAGDITAVHCTFLRNDGSAKADVENPKLMYGEVRGGVVRVSRGESDLSPEDAAINGARAQLILTEGIEDALSIALAVPEARVWAATSLGNLGNVPVNHACVASVVVAADNDWNKPEAMKALDAAIEQLRVHDIPVSVMRAHHGKDFNDLLKGAA